MNKGGRPKKKVKRDQRLTVNLSRSEAVLIKKYAAETGKSASEYLLEKGLQHELKNKLSDEERQLFQQVVGMANNLNQLTKLAHERNRSIAIELVKLLDNMHPLIQKFYDR